MTNLHRHLGHQLFNSAYTKILVHSKRLSWFFFIYTNCINKHLIFWHDHNLAVFLATFCLCVSKWQLYDFNLKLSTMTFTAVKLAQSIQTNHSYTMKLYALHARLNFFGFFAFRICWRWNQHHRLQLQLRNLTG